MRALKQKPPSEAQAKRLASIWVDHWDRACNLTVDGYNTPTDKALVRNGWIVPEGERGQWPSGYFYQRHVISPEGLAALENYLCSVRVKANAS